jgi:hypothetical protein
LLGWIAQTIFFVFLSAAFINNSNLSENELISEESVMGQAGQALWFGSHPPLDAKGLQLKEERDIN